MKNSTEFLATELPGRKIPRNFWPQNFRDEKFHGISATETSGMKNTSRISVFGVSNCQLLSEFGIRVALGGLPINEKRFPYIKRTPQVSGPEGGLRREHVWRLSADDITTSGLAATRSLRTLLRATGFMNDEPAYLIFHR
jgi:hypothetical protein